MIWLCPVDAENRRHVDFLYRMLRERDIANEGISHRRMPSHKDHKQYVKSNSHPFFYLVKADVAGHPEVIGLCYVSERKEIGIHIARGWRRLGFGSEVLKAIMGSKSAALMPGPFLANINPRNKASIGFFRKHGFTDLQLTLKKGT